MSVASERSRQFTHLILVSGALLLVACSGPGSKEAAKFEAIPLEEASLLLYAPGLEPIPSRYRRKTDGLKIFELGRWQPATGSWPDASLILLRFKDVAPAGMTWLREPPLEQRIKQWFSGDTISLGAHRKLKNLIGEGEYQRFTRNEVIPCVFIRVYGDTFSDTRGYFSDGASSLGDTMVRGWYCAPPNSRLDEAVIAAFIAGIGVKGLWVPDRPVAKTPKFGLVIPAAAAAGQDGDHPAKVKRVVFTTGISSNHEPVDDIREISLDHEGPIYIFVEWKTSLRHHAQFFNEWRVYDGGGSQKMATSKRFEPRNENWRTWLSVHFAKSYDQPGQWKFEVYFDNEKMVEKYLTVLP